MAPNIGASSEAVRRGYPCSVARYADRSGTRRSNQAISPARSSKHGGGHPAVIDMPTLTIESLTHIYPSGVKALDAVSLHIPQGLYGLLGPNGAGKSTLMRTVATLQAPTSGSIRFDDIDVLANPQALRRKLGYLPQDFGVYPRVSALEMLDHIATLKGLANGKVRRAAVEHLLHQANLWSVRHKALSGFSGGMRQRFGIAQALIGDPALIIVDEPTAGLDPEERLRFLNLLAEIGEQVVVILSTHIVDGRIVREGEPVALIAELKGRIWTKAIGRDELEACRARHAVISTRLFAGRTVVHVLSDKDPGEGFAPEEGGVEDVYFSTLFTARRAA